MKRLVLALALIGTTAHAQPAWQRSGQAHPQQWQQQRAYVPPPPRPYGGAYNWAAPVLGLGLGLGLGALLAPPPPPVYAPPPIIFAPPGPTVFVPTFCTMVTSEILPNGVAITKPHCPR